MGITSVLVSQFVTKHRILSNGYCSGIGCCQSSIPPRLQSVFVKPLSLTFHGSVNSFNPCGYAFVAGESSYTFQVSDLLHDASVDNITMDPVSMVINWSVGNRSCASAKYSLCQGGSVCVDSGMPLAVYRWNCSQGFDGNLYLSTGCQDINECKYDPCDSKVVCTNFPGYYSCSCYGDYIGDGRKNDVGCQYIPPPNRNSLYKDCCTSRS